jgi:hypothetical protein
VLASRAGKHSGGARLIGREDRLYNGMTQMGSVIIVTVKTSVEYAKLCMSQPVAQSLMCPASQDGALCEPMYPKSALVTAARSSVP